MTECRRDKIGVQNCSCPECQFEWKEECARINRRIARQDAIKRMILESEGYEVEPGPFGFPIIKGRKDG
jgi:hypothetical protein